MSLFQACTDCGSDNIVEIKCEGELVCRNCGLVLQSCMFDDSVPAGWDVVNDHYAAVTPLMTSCEAGYYDQLGRFCEMLEINKQGTEAVVSVYKGILESDACKKQGKPKGENMIALIAACIYCGCKIDNQLRCLEDICRVVGVSLRKTHSMCGWVQENSRRSKTRRCDLKSGEQLLVRMIDKVQSLLTPVLLDKDMRWRLTKTCKAIYNMANQNNIFRSKMPSKTNAAVLFIGCRALKLRVTKTQIAQALGVSVVTLSEHERLIMDIHSKANK